MMAWKSVMFLRSYASSSLEASCLHRASPAGPRRDFRLTCWLRGRTSAKSGRQTSQEIALQCHSVAALRVRRLVKILQLYREIYSEQTVRKVMRGYATRFRSIMDDEAVVGIRSAGGTMLSACLFHWAKDGISDDDMIHCVNDVHQLENIKLILDSRCRMERRSREATSTQQPGQQPSRPHSPEDDVLNAGVISLHGNNNGNHGVSQDSNCSSQTDVHSSPSAAQQQQAAVSSSEAFLAAGECLEGWEPVMDKPNLKVWRRPIFDDELFQYKVFGTWDDVPAAAFYLIQVDLEYRKAWDKLVVSLDVIDRDRASGSEVVHWVTHYPFPMSRRDYVYVRRFLVDRENNVAVLMSKGVEHPKEPISKKYVRVHRYMSNMVIRPHGKFQDKGLDYVLTYYDDPQATIPSAAMNWMASTGVPKFTEELRAATLQLIKDKGAARVNSLFERRIAEQPTTMRLRSESKDRKDRKDRVASVASAGNDVAAESVSPQIDGVVQELTPRPSSDENNNRSPDYEDDARRSEIQTSNLSGVQPATSLPSLRDADVKLSADRRADSNAADRGRIFRFVGLDSSAETNTLNPSRTDYRPQFSVSGGGFALETLESASESSPPPGKSLFDLAIKMEASVPFALRGRDYPGLHAYNPSYLVARSNVLFRGLEAFCFVK